MRIKHTTTSSKSSTPSRLGREKRNEEHEAEKKYTWEEGRQENKVGRGDKSRAKSSADADT